MFAAQRSSVQVVKVIAQFLIDAHNKGLLSKEAIYSYVNSQETGHGRTAYIISCVKQPTRSCNIACVGICALCGFFC